MRKVSGRGDCPSKWPPTTQAARAGAGAPSRFQRLDRRFILIRVKVSTDRRVPDDLAQGPDLFRFRSIEGTARLVSVF
jgi:hypothetical protein